MKRFKGMKGTIILIVLACLIIGYYYYLSNSLDSPTANVTGEEEIVATMTMSQKALSRNLQSNYPPSPREVVKYFGEITQCDYNEEHDEEEIIALGLKMREIYDAELVANQTEEE